MSAFGASVACRHTFERPALLRFVPWKTKSVLEGHPEIGDPAVGALHYVVSR